MPDEELKQIAKDCHAQVHYGLAIGASDFINLHGAVFELRARGYEITGGKSLKFSKEV